MAKKRRQDTEEAPDTAGESTRINRAQILDVAVDVFARSTFHGVSLDDVSGRLGVTRQALYYHFRRKHDILNAIFEELFELIEDALDEEESAPPEERFERMFLAYLGVIVRRPQHSSVVTREFASLPEDLDALYRERRRTMQSRFEDAYRAGVAAGALRDLAPRAAVALLLGAANWVYRWIGPEDSPEAIGEIAESLLMHGARLDNG